MSEYTEEESAQKTVEAEQEMQAVRRVDLQMLEERILGVEEASQKILAGLKRKHDATIWLHFAANIASGRDAYPVDVGRAADALLTEYKVRWDEEAPTP